jgi:hypothetical protein
MSFYRYPRTWRPVRARLFGVALANGLGSGLVLGFHADGDGIRWIRRRGIADS